MLFGGSWAEGALVDAVAGETGGVLAVLLGGELKDAREGVGEEGEGRRSIDSKAWRACTVFASVSSIACKPNVLATSHNPSPRHAAHLCLSWIHTPCPALLIQRLPFALPPPLLTSLQPVPQSCILAFELKVCALE